MKIEDIEHIKFDDAPESWDDRCSGDGYERIINEDGERVFADNGISVGIGYRPCANCGEYPTEEGHDACLGELTSVVNVCCGHGVNEGYIQFENKTIVGLFRVREENSEISTKELIEKEIEIYKENIELYKLLIRKKERILEMYIDENGELILKKDKEE